MKRRRGDARHRHHHGGNKDRGHPEPQSQQQARAACQNHCAKHLVASCLLPHWTAHRALSARRENRHHDDAQALMAKIRCNFANLLRRKTSPLSGMPRISVCLAPLLQAREHNSGKASQDNHLPQLRSRLEVSHDAVVPAPSSPAATRGRVSPVRNRCTRIDLSLASQSCRLDRRHSRRAHPKMRASARHRGRRYRWLAKEPDYKRTDHEHIQDDAKGVLPQRSLEPARHCLDLRVRAAQPHFQCRLWLRLRMPPCLSATASLQVCAVQSVRCLSCALLPHRWCREETDHRLAESRAANG